MNFVLLTRKKFSVLHFRCSRDQLAVLDAFGGNELAGNLMNFVAAAANDDDFQTIVLIQVNMQAGVHGHFSFVLHVC